MLASLHHWLSQNWPGGTWMKWLWCQRWHLCMGPTAWIPTYKDQSNYCCFRIYNLPVVESNNETWYSTVINTHPLGVTEFFSPGRASSSSSQWQIPIPGLDFPFLPEEFQLSSLFSSLYNGWFTDMKFHIAQHLTRSPMLQWNRSKIGSLTTESSDPSPS